MKQFRTNEDDEFITIKIDTTKFTKDQVELIVDMLNGLNK